MWNIIPTNFWYKTTIVAWDSIFWYDSEWIANTNFLYSAVQTFVLNWLTTTDVTEWDNLYYTEARVTANTTVVWLWTTKADKTNVLELNNTTSYTPTADYHPATKKFVNDSWTVINWLTTKTTPVNADEFIIYDSVWAVNKKTTLLNLKPILNSAYLINEAHNTTANTTTETITVTHNLWYSPTRVDLISNLWTQSWSYIFSPIQQSDWHYIWWSVVCSFINFGWQDTTNWHRWLKSNNLGYLEYSPSTSTSAWETFTINIINITTTTLQIQIVKWTWTAYAIDLSFTWVIS